MEDNSHQHGLAPGAKPQRDRPEETNTEPTHSNSLSSACISSDAYCFLSISRPNWSRAWLRSKIGRPFTPVSTTRPSTGGASFNPMYHSEINSSSLPSLRGTENSFGYGTPSACSGMFSTKFLTQACTRPAYAVSASWFGACALITIRLRYCRKNSLGSHSFDHFILPPLARICLQISSPRSNSSFIASSVAVPQLTVEFWQ